MNKEIAERIELINQGRIPKGYKENNNLKIPNEWNVLDLGNIMDFKNGLNYGKNDVGEEIKILGVGDFQKNFYLKTSDLNKIKYSDLDENYLLENGDLIFVRSNGNKELIGRVLYCENIEEKVTYSGFTIRGRLNSNDFLDKYCAYYCSSNLVKKQYMQNGGGTNISNLSQEILANVKITKPPIKEQEKIIRIISTFDRLIELKEKLLQEKQKQKKGLMERLLSGKVRVGGFEQRWNKIRLDKIIKESKERSTENNEYDILSVTKEGIFLQSEYFNRQIASEDNIGYKIVRKNELVFSAMNLWMGSIDIVDNYEVGIVSPACKVFKFKKDNVDVNFMKYFVKSSYMMNLYKLNSEQGASVVRRNLDLTGLLSTKIKFPDIKEQVAIGKVLRTADKEITLLKKELEALKQQKKGLMQLLLTGIVRV